MASNGTFLSKAGEIQQIINDSMINYKAFFRWLYMAIMHLMDERVAPEILKMTQQDIVCITEFIQNFDSITGKNNISVDGNKQTGFIMERLGQYLADNDLTMPLKTDKNEWNSFLVENKCIQEYPIIIKHNKNHSLIQQYNELVKSVELIFDKPKLLISEQSKLFQTVKCLEGESNVNLTTVNFDGATTFVAFLASNSPSEGIYALETQYSNQFTAKAVYVHFENEATNERYCVQDVKFYSANVLSVLLQEKSTKVSILYQFPTPLIRDKMTGIDRTVGLDRQEVRRVNGWAVGNISSKCIDGMACSKLAVSGSRKVAVVLSENRRKVRLFEMEAEDDDEEDLDVTNSTMKEHESVVLDDIKE